MIVKIDSPFRRLPVGIFDKKQILFLDGIKYAVEMIDIAYNRLENTLHQLSNLNLADKALQSDSNFAIQKSSAFLDAWSIVDSVNRFRTLIEQLPKLKKRDFLVDNFMKKTEEVLNLRNVVQHLSSEISNLVNKNLAVWGALSWFTITDIQEQTIRMCLLGAGTFQEHSGYLGVPAGENIKLPVDRIILTAYDYDLEITDTVNRVFQFFKKLEISLQPQIEKHIPAGDGVLTYFHGKFVDD